MWIKYLTPVMQVKCLWFLVPQDTVIVMEKGFCIQCFYGQQGRDGRLPFHSDAILSNMHNPKIIMLFQNFSMQTIENISDATK